MGEVEPHSKAVVGGDVSGPQPGVPLTLRQEAITEKMGTVASHELQIAGPSFAKGAVKLVHPSSDERWVGYLPVQNMLERLFHANSKEIEKEASIKANLAQHNPRHLDTEIIRGSAGGTFVRRAENNLEKWIKTLSFEQRLEIVLMLLKAAEELGEGNYAHGDPKPENFLVYGDTVRLADFGKTQPVEGNKPAGRYQGNTRFSPPEGQVSKNGDTYGFALCMIRVLEEEFLREKEGDETMLVSVDSKKSQEPLEQRRGIERFVLQHPDCQRTSDQWMVNMLCRVKTF